MGENELLPTFPTKVLRDGKTTIPYNIRRKLGLETGDWIVIQILKVEKKKEDRGDEE